MKIKMIIFLVVLTALAIAQPKPIHSWKFFKENLYKQTLKNVSSEADANIIGRVAMKKADGFEYILLDGITNEIIFAEDLTDVKLPQKEITVEAVVYVKRGIEYGAILSILQDTGSFEQGLVLGYSHHNFYFGLASEGADDGDGVITYLGNKKELEFGKWYHVAGVYDGKTMKIYVNGKLENESNKQHGDILYPKSTVCQIGAYKDDNEFFQMDGGLNYTAIYDKALSAEDIKVRKKSFSKILKSENIVEAELPYIVYPYLQFAQKESIVVMWETKKEMQGFVEYGTELPLKGKSEIAKDKSIFEIKLSGLKPQSNYFYRVANIDEKGNTIYSELYTFQTAVNDESPIAFGIVSDTQTNPEVWGKVSKQIFGERPNFVVHAGDIVGTGGDKEHWTEHFFKPSRLLMSRVPVFTVLGNHEDDAGHYYKYMSNPSPEYYYSFRYGKALFLMIDSNHPVEKGSEQYKMIEEDLKNKSADWKFAVFHHPPYNSDENDYGNTWRSPSTRGDRDMQPLVELFEKYDVDMVFNGHIHDYERTWPISNDKVTDDKNSVIYVTTGGGGGGLENFAPTRSPFTAKVHRDHHYCTVIIYKNKLQFKAIDQNGILFDQMEINK